MFQFEKEMVYGKEHVNVLKYNNLHYDFRPFLNNCFNVTKLSDVHKNNPTYDVFKTFGPDVQTWYHNKFYYQF